MADGRTHLMNCLFFLSFLPRIEPKKQQKIEKRKAKGEEDEVDDDFDDVDGKTPHASFDKY